MSGTPDASRRGEWSSKRQDTFLRTPRPTGGRSRETGAERASEDSVAEGERRREVGPWETSDLRSRGKGQTD